MLERDFFYFERLSGRNESLNRESHGSVFSLYLKYKLDFILQHSTSCAQPVLLKAATRLSARLQAAEVTQVGPVSQRVSALRAQQRADRMDHLGISGS